MQDYYKYIKRRFKNWAFFYDYTWIPIRYIRKEFYKFSDIGNNSKILDLCTGTGDQAGLFLNKGKIICGMDISLEMIKIANKKLKDNKLNFIAADASRMPFQDHSFDVISISFGLHEMPPVILNKALSEIGRVIKPGGTLIIADFKKSDRLLFKLGYPALKLFECKYYPEYLNINLTRVLKGYKFNKIKEKEMLGGFGVIMKFQRKE